MKSSPSSERLPDGPVIGPDGIAVYFSVDRTAAVGSLGLINSDPSPVGTAGRDAWLLVKTWRLIQVHLFRVKPWTLTVASKAPDKKVVWHRYQSKDEAVRAAAEIVRSVEANGVAGF